MNEPNRLEISRLINRFGFGPKPGEFSKLLSLGLDGARKQLLSAPSLDLGASTVQPPTLTDLGDFPPQGSPAANSFNAERKRQILITTMWWLDLMALSDHGLKEKMTWFWHGHWATSVGKVQYALPMKQQNETIRSTALGNFVDQAQKLIVDSAMLYWLDANSNTKRAPNENLSREFMELFTMGTGNYNEEDVQTIARVLTGYRTKRSSGQVTFNPSLHDSSTLTFLGTSGSFDAPGVAGVIAKLDATQNFIPRRMWFRFVSGSYPMLDSSIPSSFQSREISHLVNSIGSNSALSNPQYSLAKSPVEWFIGVCRALRITPSKLPDQEKVYQTLDNLGQVPFNPPNVGGWPSDQAWLNVASAQYRIAASKMLLANGDISSVTSSSPGEKRLSELANLLGIAMWSNRTKVVLMQVQNNPPLLVQLAINSPEYLVNA